MCRELEAKTRQKSHHQQQHQQHQHQQHQQNSGNKVLQDLFKTAAAVAPSAPQKRVPTPPLNALTEDQLLAMMAGKDAASGSGADGVAKMEVKFLLFSQVFA